MLGHLLENIWVSADKEFALSWYNRSSVVTDCGRQLTITDQGYAVEVSRRQPRSTPAVGVVTSNQLAAQLLAVEGATYSSMNSAMPGRPSVTELTPCPSHFITPYQRNQLQQCALCWAGKISQPHI
ncbi:hypothetical protein V3C99_009611 [Haemonchus contortus]